MHREETFQLLFAAAMGKANSACIRTSDYSHYDFSRNQNHFLSDNLWCFAARNPNLFSLRPSFRMDINKQVRAIKTWTRFQPEIFSLVQSDEFSSQTALCFSFANKPLIIVYIPLFHAVFSQFDNRSAPCTWLPDMPYSWEKGWLPLHAKGMISYIHKTIRRIPDKLSESLWTFLYKSRAGRFAADRQMLFRSL